jgi:hypothetical protein
MKGLGPCEEEWLSGECPRDSLGVSELCQAPDIVIEVRACEHIEPTC